MFAEYARLITRGGGEGYLSMESVTGVVLILAAGFLLVFIGFKLKGSVGAIVALLLGAIGYMFATGVLRI